MQIPEAWTGISENWISKLSGKYQYFKMSHVDLTANLKFVKLQHCRWIEYIWTFPRQNVGRFVGSQGAHVWGLENLFWIRQISSHESNDDSNLIFKKCAHRLSTPVHNGLIHKVNMFCRPIGNSPVHSFYTHAKHRASWIRVSCNFLCLRKRPFLLSKGV